ncbi:O-antigen ligase [Actibacterium sp. 188UL27-1]|uniref:O-antigen ligase family protein n=1 Tax=Actibacterium sp. 188UL27-1 TaxID=2786961 RepID=UPI001958166E|nr:O-antigen ligase [Actibacterium sp. 188UL27-1]MBM7069080.1 O-antigen ligase family protein [Actibacterium sp. 188UL27-1]
MIQSRSLSLRFDIPQRLRDHFLVTLWFIVTFKQFTYDELLLYPLALYFGWAFVRDFQLLLPILQRSLTLFIFPIWWMLSAMWGVETELILKSGAQLILTIMICYCAIIRLEKRDLILSMLVAAGIFGVLSLQAGLTGGLAARGVFSSKNAMGAAMVVLWTAAVCITLDNSLSKWLRLVAAGACVLAAQLIFISDSATAVLLAGGITGVVLIFGLLPRSGLLNNPIFLSFSCASLATGLFLAAQVLAVQHFNPITKVLEAFGKDATLTGRTVLWDYATIQIQQNPLLGVGEGGYWTPEDWTSDARKIYVEFHKKFYAQFSFHNSYYEIAVHQGLIGLAFAVMAVTWCLWRIVLGVLRENDMAMVFFFGIASIHIMRSFTESALMSPFSLLAMLFMMGALLTVKDSLRRETLRRAAGAVGPDMQVGNRQLLAGG